LGQHGHQAFPSQRLAAGQRLGEKNEIPIGRAEAVEHYENQIHGVLLKCIARGDDQAFVASNLAF
jgi:hypothetical protein